MVFNSSITLNYFNGRELKTKYKAKYNIMRTVKKINRRKTLCETTTNEKEAMNLKESTEGYRRGSGGGKGKEK